MVVGRERAGAAALRLLAATAVIATAACGPQIIDAVGPDPCLDRPGSPCDPVVWPNQLSSANSDDWLVTNHDRITEMNPRVMVLNFYNGANPADWPLERVRERAEDRAAALATGSRYHGYLDADANVFLQYVIQKVVDLADRPVPPGWTNISSTLLPTDASGAFDHLPLFNQEWGDRYGFLDPRVAGRYLTLCELFEQGLINEVWLAVGEVVTPRIPPMAPERKQVYDGANKKVPGVFEPAAGTKVLDGITCKVTVRLAHLDPPRGADCDVQVRGFGLQEMYRALPYLAPDALAFMNSDFRTRFGVEFNGWTELCNSSEVPACVTYSTPGGGTGTSPSSVSGTYRDGRPWTIPSFVQGCGTPQFPANATARWDYDNTNPVPSRCETFGMRNAPDGKSDLLSPYTAAKGAAHVAALGSDCEWNSGWEIYWRQSIPGFGNKARAHDGRPMKNWWPYLFY
jgi:hypothetical protein